MLTLFFSTTSRLLIPRTFLGISTFHSLSLQRGHMEDFTASLASLGVTDLPTIPSAHPGQNPLDIFRSHIAERLAPLAGVDPETVFAGLDRSTKPETGDFVLAVPRLRVKGAKPQELGEKWQSQVCTSFTPCLSSVRRITVIRKGCFCGIILAVFYFQQSSYFVDFASNPQTWAQVWN